MCDFVLNSNLVDRMQGPSGWETVWVHVLTPTALLWVTQHLGALISSSALKNIIITHASKEVEKIDNCEWMPMINVEAPKKWSSLIMTSVDLLTGLQQQQQIALVCLVEIFHYFIFKINSRIISSWLPIENRATGGIKQTSLVNGLMKVWYYRRKQICGLAFQSK